MNNLGQEQILQDYQTLEADGQDTWNPLKVDGELAHRLALLTCLVFALRKCKTSIKDLKVLDFGCGNGRSTRMYLDLGLNPAQLYGVDIRIGAIELAKVLHPTIQFEMESGFDFECNFLSVCTVFSSIRDCLDRKSLAEYIQYQISPNGYVFYFDLARTNTFAGRERINPTHLFANLNVCWKFKFRLSKFERPFRGLQIPQPMSFQKRLKRYVRRIYQLGQPTHQAFLFHKPEHKQMHSDLQW